MIKLLLHKKTTKLLNFNLLVLLFIGLQGHAQSVVKSVTATEFKNSIHKASIVLIDVRTKEEYLNGHIPLSIHIDVNDPAFISKIKSISKSKTIALYCRSGRRSKQAASKLRVLGNKIIELDRGFIEWKKMNFPVSTE